MSSAATAANRALGIDRGLPFPLADIARRRRVLLVGATRPTTMPPSMQYLDAGREPAPSTSSSTRGGRPPPRGAHLHLQPLPGTDLALANGLLHIAIREGYVDEDYVARPDHRLRRRSGRR